jgi:hypothetical protein
MGRVFQAYNGPAPGASAMPKVATGTALKTLLQLAPPAGINFRVIEWGASFDGSSAATPGQVELVETNGAATVTAYVAGDIVRLSEPAENDTNAQLGTALSGYTASGEGTPGACRLLDGQLVAPTNQYVKQFPLGREPIIRAGKFGRLRVTFGASISAWCYVTFEEC